MVLPFLKIIETDKRGRGVMTTEDIAAGSVLETAPVIVMGAEERKLLDQTLLHDYIFEWGENREECCMALGYVPLYNHSKESNCEYEMDFNRRQISIRAIRDIRAGEELFINYHGNWNNTKPVWFPVK
jgi:hypothetical protein